MNCLSDLKFEYHGRFGLIENVSVLSISQQDSLVKLERSNTLIRTSTEDIKIVLSDHCPVKSLEELVDENNDEFLLITDLFSCFVKIVKIISETDNSENDPLVEIRSINNNLLFHGEESLCVPIYNLYHVGEYGSIKELIVSDLTIPIEYSRYFLNPMVFKTFLQHIPNSLIIWESENLKLKLLNMDENVKSLFQSIGSIFVMQLSILLHKGLNVQMKIVEHLNRYFYWEYQYTSLEEATFAIGPKGVHITSVRSMPGIVSVVLNKHNRLRIIAENSSVLQNARQLLEIQKYDYYFENSLVPLLIGKSANHINDMIRKTGLHCIHVPNQCFDGHLNEVLSVNEPSNNNSDGTSSNKRQLTLYGRKDAIQSIRMLLEIEESVKELKLEFEMKRFLKSSTGTSGISGGIPSSIPVSSNMSSVSSLSRELFKDGIEKQEKPIERQNQNGTGSDLLFCSDMTMVSSFEKMNPSMSWADMPIEDDELESPYQDDSKINNNHHPNYHQELSTKFCDSLRLDSADYLDFYSSNRGGGGNINSGGGNQMNRNGGGGGNNQKKRNRNRRSQNKSQQLQHTDMDLPPQPPQNQKQFDRSKSNRLPPPSRGNGGGGGGNHDTNNNNINRNPKNSRSYWKPRNNKQFNQNFYDNKQNNKSSDQQQQYQQQNQQTVLSNGSG